MRKFIRGIADQHYSLFHDSTHPLTVRIGFILVRYIGFTKEGMLNVGLEPTTTGHRTCHMLYRLS